MEKEQQQRPREKAQGAGGGGKLKKKFKNHACGAQEGVMGTHYAGAQIRSERCRVARARWGGQAPVALGPHVKYARHARVAYSLGMCLLAGF